MSPRISASGSASVRGGVDVPHQRTVTRRIPPILRADACQHDVRLSGYHNRYTMMKSALAPVAAAPEALVVPGGWQIEGLPATVRHAGPQAAERTVEFFTAQIRNPHTRAAYGTAVTRFFTWCDARVLIDFAKQVLTVNQLQGASPQALSQGVAGSNPVIPTIFNPDFRFRCGTLPPGPVAAP